MPRIWISIAAAGALMTLATGPSLAERAAYGQGRYCAVVGNGIGAVKEICDFNDFESCRLEVVSGNRGFCRFNGYYTGQQAEIAAVPHKRKRHHR